ncbi:MAG: VOC family protein [Alphaproteobacteria bacterium]|jgi:catechol 2,3-dioxygenase-like lactoylglutathione lyase family enzyme|nr:VOC family protein [Alphaproteobacteria bacterium]
MASIAFAKPAFDVGFATNQLSAHEEFWGSTVGLAFDHMAKLGGGFRQHRWRLGDSIIKVNHTREPLADIPPGGYRSLGLNAAGSAEMATPDGVPVHLRPDPSVDVTLYVVTRDLDAFARFYGEVLGLEADGAHGFRLGRSRIVAEIGDPPRIEGWREKGLRYMTVQIFDCDKVTAAMERAGVEIGMSPRTIGQVRYSFARDPDGNWIELSERASLTGKPIEADR